MTEGDGASLRSLGADGRLHAELGMERVLRWGRGPMTLLLWACAGAPDAVVVAPSWSHEGPLAIGVDVVVYVPRAEVVAGEAGQELEVDLVLENIDRGLFDGTRGRRGGLAIERSRLRLLVDGQAVEPAPYNERPGWFGPVLDVSPEGPSQVRSRVSFPWRVTSPSSVVLEIPTPRGVLRAPIVGGEASLVLLGADGRLVLGPPRGLGDAPDGPPPDRTGWVTAGGEAVPPPPAISEPWSVKPGRVTVTVPGYEPQQVSVEGALTVARLRPTAEAAPWARAVALTTEDDRRSWDLEALARALRTPDEAVAYVRDHIGVLPTTGLQRSPAVTLRQGAGGPVDRAELTRALLRRQGLRVELACGDLPAGQLEVLVGEAPAPGEAALAARDAALRGMPSERPVTLRERLAVVPEWCDVAIDGEARPRDLRPPERLRAWSSAPVPAIRYWTSRASVGESLWRIDLVFRAVVREGPEAWRTVDLVSYETDAPTLSERGFVFDVYRELADGARQLRPLLSVVSDREVASQLGTAIPVGGVERILLDLTWRDPLRVSSISRSLPLWERGGGDDLDALRAAITGDAGRVPAGRLQERLVASYGGRWPAPAAHALLAEHDLLSSKTGGVAPVPVVRVTVLQDLMDGQRRRWSEQLPASAMGWESRADQGASFAAALAALDAAAGLGGAPPEPVTWASTVDAMLRLSFRDQGLQTRARREVEQGAWIGVAPSGAAWRYETDTGGVAPYGAPVIMPHFVGEEPAAEGPAGAHARWAVPVLCDGVGRFRELGVGEVPAACAVRATP